MSQFNHRVEAVLSVFRKIIFFLFLPVLGWIVFSVFRAGQEKYSFWFLLLTSALVGLLFAGRKQIRKLLFLLPYRRCVIIGAILAAAGLTGMLVIAFAVRNRIGDNWDYGLVFETAARMAAGDGAHIPPYSHTYFAMYGNNALFLRMLFRILQIIVMVTGKTDPYFLLDCTIVLNCILITASILAFSYCITGLRSVQQGLLTEFLLFLMSPFYLYAAFTYTDVYGLLPAVLVFVFMTKALRSRGGSLTDLWIALAAVSAVFGYLIKGTVIVYLLTAFFTLCFAKEFSVKRLRHLAMFAGVAVILLLVLTWSNHAFLERWGISAADREEKEIPPAHFLMMAMNPDSAGQYNSSDVEFTQSVPGKNAKKEADLEKLRERIRQMGFAGTLKHVFVTKAQFLYGTGTAGAPSYIVRAPLRESKMVDFLGRNTVFFEVTLIYKAMLEGFILILSILCFFRWKEEDALVLFAKICWIGMFLFFCIWEVHPRYTFLFLPLVGLLAAEYLMAAGNRKPDRKETLQGPRKDAHDENGKPRDPSDARIPGPDTEYSRNAYISTAPASFPLIT